MNHPENHSNKSGKDKRLVKEDYVTVPERPCKGVELIEDAAQEHFREEGFFTMERHWSSDPAGN